MLFIMPELFGIGYDGSCFVCEINLTIHHILNSEAYRHNAHTVQEYIHTYINSFFFTMLPTRVLYVCLPSFSVYSVLKSAELSILNKNIYILTHK